MRRAFTLLELMLVMIIIGVIAALAVPRMGSMQERARYTASWSQYGRFEAALNLYRAVWHNYPPDVLNSSPPPGMSQFIRNVSWTKPPPIGGQWDWNNRTNTSGANVVDWITRGPNVSIRPIGSDTTLFPKLNLLDQLVDDGSQTTGKLRRWATVHLSMPIEP